MSVLYKHGDAHPDKSCHGLYGKGCTSCGMDMDLEPFCVHVEVLKRRTEVTGREYPWGLDITPARQACNGDFYVERP